MRLGFGSFDKDADAGGLSESKKEKKVGCVLALKSAVFRCAGYGVGGSGQVTNVLEGFPLSRPGVLYYKQNFHDEMRRNKLL